MAVSGSEKTRIGASISGVGKKMTFSAKSPSGVTASLLLMNRSIANYGGMRK